MIYQRDPAEGRRSVGPPQRKYRCRGCHLFEWTINRTVPIPQHDLKRAKTLLQYSTQVIWISALGSSVAKGKSSSSCRRTYGAAWGGLTLLLLRGLTPSSPGLIMNPADSSVPGELALSTMVKRDQRTWKVESGEGWLAVPLGEDVRSGPVLLSQQQAM